MYCLEVLYLYILQSIAIALTFILYFFLRIHSQPISKAKSPKNRVLEAYETGKATKNSAEVTNRTHFSLFLAKFQTLVFENLFSTNTFRTAVGEILSGCARSSSRLQTGSKAEAARCVFVL